MRKIIIILIIALTTFMGGNIYTNNEQRLSENVTKNSEDNTIISEENTIISESSSDNFQQLSDNLEIEKELNISNDKGSEEITPEKSNVTVTLLSSGAIPSLSLSLQMFSSFSITEFSDIF